MSFWAILGIVAGSLALVALIAFRRWRRRQPVPNPKPPKPDPPDPPTPPPVPPLPGDGTVFVLYEAADLPKYTADQRDILGDPAIRKALTDADYRFLVFDQHVVDERGRIPQQYARYFEASELDRLPWMIVETVDENDYSGQLPETLADFWKAVEAI